MEGSSDPIDLISIKQHGSFVPEKYICNESVNLTITKFSGFFSKEEIKSELFDKSICSLLISLLVEIFNKGTLVEYRYDYYYRKIKTSNDLKSFKFLIISKIQDHDS